MTNEYYQTHKEQYKKYYQIHKEQCKNYQRNYRQTHKEYWKKYVQTHPQNPERMREYRIKLRKEIINLFGNKCCKCGFDDFRALQIDHVNGGGCRQSRELFGCSHTGSVAYYKHILDSIKSSSKDYQILCANCNTIKRYTNKEVGGR
jgi:hypothetical protein